MIYLVDKNKELIEKCKPYENSFIKVIHGDIFEVAKERKAKIATASNPDFDFAGGLDAQIAKRFDVSDAKEFEYTDDLFFLISVNRDRLASKNIIRRAFAGVYAFHRKFDIAISGIGTGIGGLTLNEFVNEFIYFSQDDFGGADLSRANLREADLSWTNLHGANLSEANLRGANLSWADLSRANLRGADLSRANLRGADLSRANLRGADLSEANLSEADLSEANLRGADLYETNLNEADLRGAYLSEANLCGANLHGANLDRIIYNEHTAFFALQCPEEGDFVGWKKCRKNVIVKLLIPADAKRSSATSRKCRAEFVKVLDVIGDDVGVSQYNDEVIYRKGDIVRSDYWDDDRWNDCSGGIHFFITRKEAEQY